MIKEITFHRSYRKLFNNVIIAYCKRFSSSNITEDYVRHKILSEKGKHELIKKISSLPNVYGTNKKRQSAGVLVPFCITNNSLSLLYTMRSAALSGYSGQISFPGGKMDESDSSVIDAASRETSEETGLPVDSVQVWVNAPTFPDRSGKYHVTPVIGYLGDIDVKNLNYNKEEVSEVICMPVTKLLDPDIQRYTTFRNGWTMPVFRTSSKNIWGLTGTITELILSIIFPDDYKRKLRIYDRKKKLSYKYLER